jgi:hypothetical protein
VNVGPGFFTPPFSIVPVEVVAVALLGAILLRSFVIRGVRSHYKERWRPASHQAGFGLGVLSVGVLFFALFALLSIGVIPGWYWAQSGSSSVYVVDCGGFLGGGGIPPEFPDGFPPGSQVSLTWTTSPTSDVHFRVQQYLPNSENAPPAWSLDQTGQVGSMNFTGNGGTALFSAWAATECPQSESVVVHWTYTPKL